MREPLRHPDPFDLDQPIPVEGMEEDAQAAPDGESGESKIRAFDQKLVSGRHEDTWERSPNVTGTGAIHVKSFHCKLSEESLHYLDTQVNEWLDAHPQYEVKFVTTAVGDWISKTREPNLIVQVWV